MDGVLHEQCKATTSQGTQRYSMEVCSKDNWFIQQKMTQQINSNTT
jgi:hypothetical protein